MVTYSTRDEMLDGFMESVLRRVCLEAERQDASELLSKLTVRMVWDKGWLLEVTYGTEPLQFGSIQDQNGQLVRWLSGVVARAEAEASP